jgi:hypothetical protein
MLEIRAVGELSLRIKKIVSPIRSTLKRKSLSSPLQKRRRFPRVLPQLTILSDDRLKSGCMAKSALNAGSVRQLRKVSNACGYSFDFSFVPRVSCSIRVSEVFSRILLEPFRAW